MRWECESKVTQNPDGSLSAHTTRFLPVAVITGTIVGSEMENVSISILLSLYYNYYQIIIKLLFDIG